MAIDSREAFENIKSSVEVYVKTFLDAESLEGEYEGQDFDDSGVDEWVRITFLAVPQRQLARNIGSNRRGEFSRALVQFDSFVKMAKTTNANRHHELRDIVASNFRIGQTISWRDYRDTQAVLGDLQVHSVETDETLPEEEGVIGWAYAVLLEWMASYTKP